MFRRWEGFSSQQGAVFAACLEGVMVVLGGPKSGKVHIFKSNIFYKMLIEIGPLDLSNPNSIV